jgi:hypothetical protein
LPVENFLYLLYYKKNLVGELDNFIALHAESKEYLNRKNEIKTLLTEALQKLYPKAELKMFGSSVSGLGFSQSDCDFCLSLPREYFEQYKKSQNFVEPPGYRKVKDDPYLQLNDYMESKSSEKIENDQAVNRTNAEKKSLGISNNRSKKREEQLFSAKVITDIAERLQEETAFSPFELVKFFSASCCPLCFTLLQKLNRMKLLFLRAFP